MKIGSVSAAFATVIGLAIAIAANSDGANAQGAGGVGSVDRGGQGCECSGLGGLPGSGGSKPGSGGGAKDYDAHAACDSKVMLQAGFRIVRRVPGRDNECYWKRIGTESQACRCGSAQDSDGNAKRKGKGGLVKRRSGGGGIGSVNPHDAHAACNNRMLPKSGFAITGRVPGRENECYWTRKYE